MPVKEKPVTCCSLDKKSDLEKIHPMMKFFSTHLHAIHTFKLSHLVEKNTSKAVEQITFCSKWVNNGRK